MHGPKIQQLIKEHGTVITVLKVRAWHGISPEDAWLMVQGEKYRGAWWRILAAGINQGLTTGHFRVTTKGS